MPLPFALTEVGSRVRDADIVAFEAEIGARLPYDYRCFLLENNGGMPLRNAIHITGSSWTPTNVFAFFGLGRSLDTSDIRWNREIYANQSIRYPLLPIACDDRGCPFCLVLDGPDRRAIVYIDLEALHQRHVVAPGFTDFIEQMRIDFAAPWQGLRLTA